MQHVIGINASVDYEAGALSRNASRAASLFAACSVHIHFKSRSTFSFLARCLRLFKWLQSSPTPTSAAVSRGRPSNSDLESVEEGEGLGGGGGVDVFHNQVFLGATSNKACSFRAALVTV